MAGDINSLNLLVSLCGEGFDEKLRLRPLVADEILNILKLFLHHFND